MPIIPHMRASHFALKRIDLSPSAQTSLSHQGGGDGFNWANARLETRNNYVTNWLPASYCLERRPARPLRTTPFGTETHASMLHRRNARRCGHYPCYLNALSSASTIEASISSRATNGSRCYNTSL